MYQIWQQLFDKWTAPVIKLIGVAPHALETQFYHRIQYSILQIYPIYVTQHMQPSLIWNQCSIMLNLGTFKLRMGGVVGRWGG